MIIFNLGKNLWINILQHIHNMLLINHNLKIIKWRSSDSCLTVRPPWPKPPDKIFYKFNEWKSWRLRIVFQQIIQNDHRSVAFVMYSLITWIICWKTFANLHNFYSLILWTILSIGLGKLKQLATVYRCYGNLLRLHHLVFAIITAWIEKRMVALTHKRKVLKMLETVVTLRYTSEDDAL